MRFLKPEEYRELLTKGIPENVEERIGEIFFENTKLRRLFKQYYGVHLKNILSTPYFVQRMLLPFKTLPSSEGRRLEIETGNITFLEKLILNRRSPYKLKDHIMDFKILSNILYYSYGITKKKEMEIIDEWNNKIKVFYYYRPTPSAGGLYPHEIYIIALRVSGIDPGIYHYNPFESIIEKVSSSYKLRVLEGKLWEIFTGLPEEPWLVGIIITAIPNRQVIKYFSRAYRFIFLEAGHIAQNISLLATANGLGVLPVGGYYDDELISLLNIDQRIEIPIYPLFVGKPKSTKKEIKSGY